MVHNINSEVIVRSTNPEAFNKRITSLGHSTCTVRFGIFVKMLEKTCSYFM